MKKHRLKKDGRGGLIFGVLISVLSFFLSLLIFSFILSIFENPISFVSIASLAAFLVSGAVSAFATAKYKGEGGTVTALLSSLLASAVIFAVGLICCGGKIKLSLLMNILCYLLVSAIFARLAGIKKKRRRGR